MKPTLREWVRACIQNKEMVAEFDRLNGTNLLQKGPPLVKAIDLATGKLADDIRLFLAFCQDTYDRLPND